VSKGDGQQVATGKYWKNYGKRATGRNGTMRCTEILEGSHSRKEEKRKRGCRATKKRTRIRKTNDNEGGGRKRRCASSKRRYVGGPPRDEE